MLGSPRLAKTRPVRRDKNQPAAWAGLRAFRRWHFVSFLHAFRLLSFQSLEIKEPAARLTFVNGQSSAPLTVVARRRLILLADQVSRGFVKKYPFGTVLARIGAVFYHMGATPATSRPARTPHTTVRMPAPAGASDGQPRAPGRQDRRRAARRPGGRISCQAPALDLRRNRPLVGRAGHEGILMKLR